ncbi:MAG TPA: hypothetical protein VIA45_05665 [Thermoanaerobaculia bacterium]|jgi:hypothetical protein
MNQKTRGIVLALAGAVALSCAPSPAQPPRSAASPQPSHPGTAAVSLEDVVTTSPPVFGSSSAPAPEPTPADGASLDRLLQALYDGVSHTADAEPNWERLAPLFVPGARLTPPKPPGDARWVALSFDEFRDAVRKGIASRRADGKPAGFFEREIGRETHDYGNVTDVLSAYEGRFRADDPKPFIRGVNFLQVVRAGERLAFVSIVWDTERPENPIPERLLPPSAN